MTMEQVAFIHYFDRLELTRPVVNGDWLGQLVITATTNIWIASLQGRILVSQHRRQAHIMFTQMLVNHVVRCGFIFICPRKMSEILNYLTSFYSYAEGHMQTVDEIVEWKWTEFMRSELNEHLRRSYREIE